MARPNILLITTDQQRFDTINALGNPDIHTPHLDWLTDEGISFTRAYADSPICMPSRATIMMGKRGFSTGLVGNQTHITPMADHPTLPGVLTKAGYQTRAQGKMHFHPMRAHYGFETMELPMDYYRERHRAGNGRLPKEHGVGENEVQPVISTVHENESLTHWTVRRSVDFLETRDDTRPFFLWTSFAKPHPPFDPCANYWALYANKKVADPVIGDWAKEVEDIPQGFMASTYILNNTYRASIDQLRDTKRAYYACITQIDYNLGLLFARMREMDLLENTWIIFTSDHGDMMGDHHMGAKSVFLEGSAHIPLIVRPPAGSWDPKPMAGKQADTLVDLADIMPTVLNIAGAKCPAGVDGKDLLQLAQTPDSKRVFYGNSSSKQFAVIEGPWKYTWTSIGGGELLFDLAKDPQEKHNLIQSKSAATQLKSLRAKLTAHIKKHSPQFVKNGRLAPGKGISGPRDCRRWPGYHTTVYNCDVLH